MSIHMKWPRKEQLEQADATEDSRETDASVFAEERQQREAEAMLAKIREEILPHGDLSIGACHLHGIRDGKIYHSTGCTVSLFWDGKYWNEHCTGAYTAAMAVAFKMKNLRDVNYEFGYAVL